jgi:uncharacterized linocin/CFP29 family protein
MNGNLGRDRLWNDYIWSEIDKAVQEEVGRIRVAQKVFPSGVVNNVSAVSTTRTVDFGAAAPPAAQLADQFQPFFEISSRFVLTQEQVDGEENIHLGQSRARLAASAVANAEDRILFLGPGAIAGLAGVNVTNQPSIPPGFVAEAAQYDAVEVPDAAAGGDLGNILAGVADGIVALNGRTQPGPYAVFLPPRRYGQTFQPPQGQLRSPGDQINHVATGGCYMVNCLQADAGILVSLGGEPAKIILGSDAMTAFTNADEQGNYHFRVFERIQLVVRDGRAFQTLAFREPAGQNPQPQNPRRQNQRRLQHPQPDNPSPQNQQG